MKIDISSIINKFAGLDNAGEKPSKIDTYLEYYKLGEYLSGNLYTEELPSYNDLKKRDKNLLQKAYQEAKKYLNESFSKKDNCIQITSSNAEEYAQIYHNLSFEDESRASQDYDLLGKALYEYCKNNGYDMSGLTYDNCDYNFIISCIVKRDKTEAEMRERGQVVLDRIKNPYDNDILKNAVEKRIREESIQTLNPTKYTSDIGNGQYDKPATQKTNLCWAHAGIKSLSLTEKGRIFFRIK